MKKALIVILFICFGTAYSQWVSNYNGNPGRDVNFANAKGNSIATDNSGNSYVTGYSYESETDNDIIIIKYELSGAVLW
ncbi:MAG: SBBP repeat-containing protein, partial [Ignavibacteria bacterium]